MPFIRYAWGRRAGTRGGLRLLVSCVVCVLWQFDMFDAGLNCDVEAVGADSRLSVHISPTR